MGTEMDTLTVRQMIRILNQEISKHMGTETDTLNFIGEKRLTCLVM